MNLFRYILQGFAHEIVLFLNFLDFSWLFFASLGILLILAFIKSLLNNLLTFFKTLFNVIKTPVIFIGILLIFGMYVLSTYLFDEDISFYFVLITLISLIRDIVDFYKDVKADISFHILLKDSFSLAKGSLLLLLVRIINIIDTWNLESLKYIYIYPVYLLALLVLTFIKRLYIIIDEHRCRCHIKGGNYSRASLFLLYFYTVFYIRDLDISYNMLFAFYKQEKTSTIRNDMNKIRILALKLMKIMKQTEIDKPLLKRIGVDSYEHKIQKNL